jgi:hypothetical protein
MTLIAPRQESVGPLLAKSRFLADKPGFGMTSVEVLAANCATHNQSF